MKCFTIWFSFFLFTGLLITAAGANGQEVHFTQVQDMNSWYNPALKINKTSLVHVNIRSVNYRSITSYSSKAATIELPLINKEKDEQDNIGYLNLSAGINASSSGAGAVNSSVGMLAISYALPLNNDNTYLAAGLQGAYTFSRVNYDGYAVFPDHFDEDGPVGAALLIDPLQTGNQYTYFTAGVGAAFFHSGEKRQWYVGGSIRHLNQPFTGPNVTHFRLPINRSTQAGYTTTITEESSIGVYGAFTWQDRVYEHVIGALYSHSFGDSAHIGLSLGVGYRIGDALIPNAGFRIGKHRFAFSYEFNVFRSEGANYNRKAFDLAYTLNL